MEEPEPELIGDVLRSLVASWSDHELVMEKELARRLDVSPAAYSNYKENKRVPGFEKAKRIAVAWARYTGLPVDAEQIDAVARRLATAQQREPPSFFPRLMRDETELRVSKLNLGVFGDFFRTVFERYAREAGVALAHRDMTSPERLRTELGSGQTHVALAVFDSVSRLLWARFLPMLPVRISLSAVGLFSTTGGPMGRQVVDLSHALARGEGPSSVRYRPLVVAGGVGEQHCRNTLTLAPSEFEVEHTLDPAVLAGKLRRMKRELEGDGELRPVFVGDEYTCIRLLSELKREGRLLFPLSTRENLRQIPLCQDLPRYRATIGVGRTHVELFEFLRESLTTFLCREFHMVASAVASLYMHLEAEVRTATAYMYRWQLDTGQTPADWVPTTGLGHTEGNRLAAEYCRHVLHLDAGSIENATTEVATWIPLLRRVREIVLTGLTRDRVVYYDAVKKLESTERLVRALLLQLAAKYRSMVAEKAAADIEEDCRDLSTRYGVNRGRVLLVSEDSGEDEDEKKYIGVLCVTTVNHLSRDPSERAAQLRYLWVNPMYQGECIGKVLIQEAVRYAALELKARIVYVEVMPTLERAINLFRDAGFRAGHQLPEYSDRLMFELPVSTPNTGG